MRFITKSSRCNLNPTKRRNITDVIFVRPMSYKWEEAISSSLNIRF
jgi:hypothetical protein